jgi:hypothetical protein
MGIVAVMSVRDHSQGEFEFRWRLQGRSRRYRLRLHHQDNETVTLRLVVLQDMSSSDLERKGPWLRVDATSNEDVGSTPMLPLEPVRWDW